MANTVIQKKEEMAPAGVERTSTLPVFVPRCDIFETSEGLVLLADMPGVDEKTVSIDLEGGVLTVSGRAVEEAPVGELAYREFRAGDFKRAFTLTEEVDTAKIEATLKNGVLRVHLPKMERARPKKIPVVKG
jgi:HSP20 family protein